MPNEVAYPVEVQSYQVSVNQDSVEIEMEGIERSLLQGIDQSSARIRQVGRLSFFEASPRRDFINRGGFLQMDRPLLMLSGIIDLLHNEKPFYLHRNGTLSTSLEPIGEAESG